MSTHNIGFYGDLCCILYSIVNYLYVSFSRFITSVGEEKANFSAIVYLYLNVVSVQSLEEFPVALGAWDRLHY